MEIEEKRIQEVPVLTVEGRIGYDETPRLKDTLSQLVEQGHKYLVLDMKNVSFMCSWAIGSILTTNGRLRKNSGEIRLSRIKPELKELLDLLGLHGTLKSYPSTKEAVRAIRESD